MGNEGAYLPNKKKNKSQSDYWKVTEETLKFLESKNISDPKEQSTVLDAVKHKITPRNELATISSEELLQRYEESSKHPVEFEGLKTGLPTLDDYLLGVQKQNFMVICARTGVGKCHKIGTKVLMADGSIKNIEDISVGEKVQGIDGPRNVTGVHSGFGPCYKITPKKGEPFYVTDNHFMSCLRYKEIFHKRRVYGWERHIEDILIEDLIGKRKHPDGTFTHYKLYRPKVEYDEKNLIVDPYILGIWLGDGHSNSTSLTTMDLEIREKWLDVAKQYDMNVREQDDNTGKATTYHLSTRRGKNNPFLEALKELNIINNKHIPLDFLTGSREQRLSLLAGLLDTDGYLNMSGTFEITQKNRVLAENIAQLARGLGFGVTHKVKTIKNIEYQRINIFGDTNLIPTLLKRKQAKERKTRRNPLVTGFKIERVEDSEYFGIAVDGDKRYLLGDNTLTHNTLVANYMIANFAAQGEKILYLALEESEDEVGDRWAKVVINNKIDIPPDSVHFSYSEMISAIKEDKYNLIPLIPLYAQLGFTMICVDMLNNLIDTVRDEDGNVFLNRLVSAAQASNMTIIMTARLRQPQYDKERDFPTMESVYGRVDLGYIVSKCIAVTSLPDEGDGSTYLRLHIIKNRRKRIGMKLLYPKIRVNELLQIHDIGDDVAVSEQLSGYESKEFGSRTGNNQYRAQKNPVKEMSNSEKDMVPF